MNISVNIY